MLKEYLSEVVSLLAEAVLGKPTPVSAGCPRIECTGWVCDPCNWQCPYNNKKCQRYCRDMDPCAGYYGTWWSDVKCRPC